MSKDISIVFRSVDELVPHAKNSKEHPPEQVAEIARSMQEFGWTNPILIDEHGGVIAGHGRILGAKLLQQRGVKSLRNLADVSRLPCVELAHLTPAQRRAYVIADNKLAENAPWNLANLKTELLDLRGMGFDLTLTGFSPFELERVEDGPDSIEDVPHLLDGAKSLKAVLRIEDSGLPYGIPALRRDMLGEIPPGLRTFAGREVTPDDGESWYLWLWRSDSLRGLPRERHVIGFYVDDYRFESIYELPNVYVGKMLNMGTRLALGINFSSSPDMPMVWNLWTVYRARYCTRYLQEAGIAVIPDAHLVPPSMWDFAYLGIPEGAPAISVQLQNVKTDAEYRMNVAALREIIDRLKPQSLLVYGGNPGRKVLDAVAPSCGVTFVQNRATVKAGHIRQGQSRDVMA